MSTTTIPSFEDIAHLGTLDSFTGFGGIELTINRITHAGETVDSPAREIVATADGRGACYWEWHEGPESDEPVYFEVWRAGDGSVHGWVDGKSRKIVQVG